MTLGGRADAPPAAGVRRPPAWLVRASIGGWLCYGAFHGTQYFLASPGSATGALVVRCVLLALAVWGVGLGATAVSWWSTERYPLERGRRMERLVVHAGLSLAVVTAQAGAFAAMRTATRYFVPGDFRAFLLDGLDFRLLNYWALVGAMHAYHFSARRRTAEVARARSESAASALAAQLAQARLQALKMQLNPHFLFNALNTVSSLMHHDVPLANRMLVRVSEYLRLTLETVESQQVTLEREMDHLRAYLEIESIRFRDRLAVTWAVDEEAGDGLVPHLILQPLVENALRHGLELAGGGELEIGAARAGDELVLSVRNAAAAGAAPPPQAGGAGEHGFGVGLGNARARLRELHPGRWDLTVVHGAPGETRVAIRLPYREGAGGGAPAAGAAP
ncbi:MAG TPA: histidine kinase [Longimicrobium sp.]|uniref:sensor histidine kinase n=1 Tax=Longimicrobium sp. TaxID=2029185 RepID=UPI002ED77FED